MATGTLGGTGRRYHQAMLHMLAVDFFWAPGTGTVRTISMGSLPAGAQILAAQSGIILSTAFDGTTLVDIGKPGSVQFYASALVTTAAAVLVPLDATAAAAGNWAVAVDTPIILTVTSTAATVGAGKAFLLYIP